VAQSLREEGRVAAVRDGLGEGIDASPVAGLAFGVRGLIAHITPPVDRHHPELAHHPPQQRPLEDAVTGAKDDWLRKVGENQGRIYYPVGMPRKDETAALVGHIS
jgi:hypothetical protein